MRQIAVIGLGKFGSTVARELIELGAQVIAIDRNKNRVEELRDAVTCAVTLNALDESSLRAVGAHQVDAAVVCIGEDVEANLLATLLLKKIGVSKVYARAISPLQQEILKALEVDAIINLEEEMGQMVARSLVSANLGKHLVLGPGFSVAELNVTPTMAGQTLRQLDPRKNFAINIVAVKKRRPRITETGDRTFAEETQIVPSPDAPLEDLDVLIVAGRDEDINRFAGA